MDILNKPKKQIYNEAFWLGYIRALEEHAQDAEVEVKRLKENLLNCVKDRDAELLRLKERIEYLKINIPNK